MNMAKIQIKRGLQEAVARLELAGGRAGGGPGHRQRLRGHDLGKVHINPTGRHGGHGRR